MSCLKVTQTRVLQGTAILASLGRRPLKRAGIVCIALDLSTSEGILFPRSAQKQSNVRITKSSFSSFQAELSTPACSLPPPLALCGGTAFG